MRLQLNATGVLAVAGLAVGGYLLWRGSRVVSDVTDAAGQVWDSAKDTAADVWGGVQHFDQLGTGTGPESNLIGLPEPEAVASEPEVARWILDNFGTWEASKWVTMTALLRAMTMDAGTGRPPAADSEAGRYLIPRNPNYDETARLAARYPRKP